MYAVSQPMFIATSECDALPTWTGLTLHPWTLLELEEAIDKKMAASMALGNDQFVSTFEYAE